jgi:glycosyltransferase involved in cell wall biosynthesis
MSPHRILYVVTKPRWGGAQRYVYDLALAARDRGDKVKAAFGGEGELGARLEAEGIETVRIPGLGRDVDPAGDLRALFALRALISSIKPDIVHLNSSKAGLLGALAARLARHRPRVVFTVHGWAFNEARPAWQRGVFALMPLITVWCADEVICVSDAARRQAAWMPAATSKFRVIHNGVPQRALMPKEGARSALAPDAPQGALWIGTLAELHPTKGLDILLRALPRIDGGEGAHIVLIGEGQARAELEALARSLGIAERVHFCGHVEDAARYLGAFDIFAFPSRSEGLGYAALEAGLAALPVAASRVGGIPEIIVHGVTGLLVPPGDADALAAALEALVTDEKLRATLGARLRARVLQDFSVERMVEKTLAVYDKREVI